MSLDVNRYRLFRLVIETDVPIADLPMPRANGEEPDVVLWFEPEEMSWLNDGTEIVLERPAGDGSLVVRRHPRGSLWQFGDDTSFLISHAADEIFVSRPDHFTIADVVTYLVGPILGHVLRRRGVRTLHGSVVDVDGSALAIVGSAGAGKSTLAAELVSRGHRLVAEDVAPLVQNDSNRFAILPGIPFVKLWPPSAARFGDLPTLTPNWSKRFLDASDSFATAPVELGSICLLSETSKVSSTRLGPRDALVELISNVYSSAVLTPRMRADDLDALGDLVEDVAVWRTTRTTRFEDIDALVAAVLSTLDRR